MPRCSRTCSYDGLVIICTWDLLGEFTMTRPNRCYRETAFIAKFLPTLITISLALAANGARADWDYTRWGMSPAEAKQAAQRDSVREIDPSKWRALSTFVGTTCKLSISAREIAGIIFEVRLCFDETNRLNAVHLYTDGDRFFEVDRALRAAYGTPINQDGGALPVRQWRDAEKGNTIRLLRVTSTIVEYRPLPKGL